MLKRNQKNDAKTIVKKDVLSGADKIANLLALMVIKDIEQISEKATILRSAGFQIAEVAALLSMTELNVRVATHAGRKRKGKAAKKKGRSA